MFAAFRREHERAYGYAPNAPVQLVSYRIAAQAHVTAPLGMREERANKELGAGLLETRSVYFRERGGYVDYPVYDQTLVPVGAEIEGPAIFDQMDMTTLVPPGQIASDDSEGSLILTFK